MKPIINYTFSQSFEQFNDLLIQLGESPISEFKARNKFGIEGGESNADLYQWALDYANDQQTERAAAKHSINY